MAASQPGYVPTDFIDAIPVLPYSDIRAAHDFLVEVVGFDSAGLVEHDGHVVHGEVRAGDRRFWLHEASGGLTTPAAAAARTAGIVLHVRDVDAHYQHARAAGATILRDPTNEDYGQREYGLRDLEGHDWYIATPFAPPAS
jgi:MerR family transcriptional regulator, thiopeptide resistance regulator